MDFTAGAVAVALWLLSFAAIAGLTEGFKRLQP
jgi:hypothetical protein